MSFVLPFLSFGGEAKATPLSETVVPLVKPVPSAVSFFLRAKAVMTGRASRLLTPRSTARSCHSRSRRSRRSTTRAAGSRWDTRHRRRHHREEIVVCRLHVLLIRSEDLVGGDLTTGRGRRPLRE